MNFVLSDFKIIYDTFVSCIFELIKKWSKGLIPANDCGARYKYSFSILSLRDNLPQKDNPQLNTRWTDSL